MKKSIIVFSRFLLLMALVFNYYYAHSQKVSITGKVVDSASGDPLPGATITIKGAKQAIVADENGDFRLSLLRGQIVKVSIIGYQPKEIPYTGQARLDIELSGQAAALNQVVVVGYGTQKRSTLSGAVATLDENVMTHSNATNVGTALEGQLPGLHVQQSTGQPGASPNIVFRGGTSYDGSGTPLFVVDGIIVPDLYGLNMDDIASVTELKDAASTAIYGARASNGVILITTKKGKQGHSSLTYSIRETSDFPPINPVNYLNGAQYIHWNRYALGNRWAADVADGNTNAAANDMNQIYGAAWGWSVSPTYISPIGTYSTQLVTDANRHLIGAQGWNLMTDPNPFVEGQTDSILYRDLSAKARESMILQQQTSQDHYLNFSGGSDVADFDLGLGLTKDNGVIIGTSLKRISMNFNGGLKVGKKLKINMTTSAYNAKQALPYEPFTGSFVNIIQRFIGGPPTQRLTNDTSGAMLPGQSDVSQGNPAYWSQIYNNSSTQQRFMGGLHLTYNFLPGFDFLASGTGYVMNTTNNYFTKAYQNGNGGPIITTRPASYNITNDVQYSYNAFLKYNKKFAGNDLTVMGGSEFYDFTEHYYSGSGSGAPTDFIPWLSASLPVSISNGGLLNPQTAYSDFNSWNRLASVIGRVNYSYQDKYFLTANFRYDGTSQLSTYRYGFFPGISAGWNMQNEPFFQHSRLSKYISVLKPRLSWGENGSIYSIGNYATAQVYSSTPIYDGQGSNYYPNYINSNLKWESSATSNYGLDVGVWNNRIYLTADYFIRNVYNKVASQPIALSTGFTSYTTNLGQLQNRGFELKVTGQIIQPKQPHGFSWQMSANYYTVKSYAIKLPYNGLPGNRQGTIQIYDSKGNIIQEGGLIEGQRIGLDEVWAPRMDGIYRTQAQIDKDAGVYNSYLPYHNKYLKTLGDAVWHQTYQNDTINSRQFVYVGRTTPDVSGGFTTTFGYKGFSLYAQFDYALNFVILNEVKLRSLSLVQGSSNPTTAILNTWTPQNPDAPLPKVYWANQGRNYGTDAGSSNPFAQMWENGDYLCVRNVSLSYQIPKDVLDRTFHQKIQGFQLSVSGTNLHYFSKYDGYNKETGGMDQGSYPLPIGLTFGANISF